MNLTNKHLQIAELHKKNKNDLKDKLKINYPHRTRKQIITFFNNDIDLINQYDSERALLKKQIAAVIQKIKYNEDVKFREKNNGDIKIRREKKKQLIKIENENNEIKELKNIINDKDNIIDNKDKIIDNKDKIIDNKDKDIFEQKKIIKEDKKTIFNLNMVIKDLKYDIKNLKYDYKINSDKLSSSSSSSSSFDKKLKIDIDYTEIKELSDNKINKYLCSMGYKYDDIKDLSKHEKKQLFNKKNNDKIIRLFNK